MKCHVFAGLSSYMHSIYFNGQNSLPKISKAKHVPQGVQKLLCCTTYYLHIYESYNSRTSQTEYQLEVTISDIQDQEFYLQKKHYQRCCSHLRLSQHSLLASYWAQHQSPTGQRMEKF